MEQFKALPLWKKVGLIFLGIMIFVIASPQMEEIEKEKQEQLQKEEQAKIQKEKQEVAVKKKEIEAEIALQKAIKNTLKGGYGACISADLFDQFTTVAVNNDEKGINYLLKNGCFVTKKGIEFSLIDRSFTGTAKIRVYSGDEAFILWTNNENLNL